MFERVTLRGRPLLVDVSRNNPGEMYYGEGDTLENTDGHARVYDPKNKKFLGVYCAHSQSIETTNHQVIRPDTGKMVIAHNARGGTLYCPASQVREPVQ
jgi:hypothetical protein